MGCSLFGQLNQLASAPILDTSQQYPLLYQPQMPKTYSHNASLTLRHHSYSYLSSRLEAARSFRRGRIKGRVAVQVWRKVTMRFPVHGG
jgi:hypothetical protein